MSLLWACHPPYLDLRQGTRSEPEATGGPPQTPRAGLTRGTPTLIQRSPRRATRPRGGRRPLVEDGGNAAPRLNPTRPRRGPRSDPRRGTRRRSPRGEACSGGPGGSPPGPAHAAPTERLTRTGPDGHMEAHLGGPGADRGAASGGPADRWGATSWGPSSPGGAPRAHRGPPTPQGERAGGGIPEERLGEGGQTHPRNWHGTVTRAGVTPTGKHTGGVWGTSGDKMEAGVVAVCTVGVVVLLVSGGKPGCSYRGFPQPTLSTPCDPGSQSGRPGSLSPNHELCRMVKPVCLGLSTVYSLLCYLFLRHGVVHGLTELSFPEFVVLLDAEEFRFVTIDRVTGVGTLKQRFNQTGERPRVSLLQRSPSSPVVCHATGFYPDRVVVFWRRHGQELHEQVDPGEVLPNHDGTFQVSVDLNLKAVPQEDWGRYECVVQLKGIEDISTPLDPALIRTNSEDKSGLTIPIIIGLLVLLLAAAAAVVGVLLYKKRNASDKRHKPVGSDTSSENTEGQNPAPEAQPLTKV
ncbi:unnamed protein product [Gadus morhua 'NCC']